MNEPLRQKKPPLSDEKYLAAIRKLPCCVCGRSDGDSDAAHLRMSDAEFGGLWGKTSTGFGQKPSDNFCVPLCRPTRLPDPVARLIKKDEPLRMVNVGCHGRQHGHQVGFINPAADQATRDSIEVRFWKQVGKNPFQIAQVLYEKFGSTLIPRKKTKWRAPKVKTERPKPKRTVKAKIPSRPFPKGRKIATRKKK